ncbi:MAG: hypothetical protein WD295_06605 [Bacteroidota bacterium]
MKPANGKRRSGEFEAKIQDDGSVVIPASQVRGAGWKPGSGVTVRLTDASLSAELRRRGVTEEELERIAAIQREDPKDILRMLMTEGALARNARFCRRITEHLA